VLHRHKYLGTLFNEDGDEVEVTADPGETLASAVERITKDAEELADQFKLKVEYLAKRHKLAQEMAALEAGADVPLKTLEKRVAVLQQIKDASTFINNRLGWDVKGYTEPVLKERVDLIETINRLEPGEAQPIKKLRQRAKLLERIEQAEPEDIDGEALRDRLEDKAAARAIAAAREDA
jgi:hypothetical protein